MPATSTDRPARKKARRKTPDWKRLCQAIQTARTALAPFRRARTETVKKYAGHNWGGEGYEEIPVNFLSLYKRIITPNLVAKNPRFLLSVFDKKNKPAVNAMNLWMDREVERVNLAEVLRRAVVDALYYVGIIKVDLATPSDSAASGWNLPPGTPYADVVDLDDFAFDVHAKKFSQASFLAHRVRKPLEVVKATRQYGARRLELQPDDDPLYNEDGDERVALIGRGAEGNSDEFEDMVTLWEVYLPRQRLMVTMGSDQGGGPVCDGEPLWVREWLGPDAGPFHFLSFGVVPDNAMPKGPVTDLVDLADAANSAFRKLLKQAGRLKKTYPFTHEEDVKKFAEANDGEAFSCKAPELIKELTSGGADPNLLVFFETLRGLFDFFGGNLSILGGLSPQSKTAAQDKMLNENSSRSVLDMQAETSDCARRVGTALLWFYWHHPTQEMETTYSPPGLPEYTASLRLGPADRPNAPPSSAPLKRSAAWDTLDLKVDPYSLRPATPESRANALLQLVTQVLAPILPVLQQQGIAIDMNAFLSKYARYQDMPDLTEIVTISEPPQHGPGGPDQGTSMPGVSQRSYTRENVPMRTEQGDMMNRRNALMGINPGGNPSSNGQPMLPGGAR